MFRLILIYPVSLEDIAPREYTERSFPTMADVLAYLASVHTANVYRVIIERL